MIQNEHRFNFIVYKKDAARKVWQLKNDAF